MQLKDFQEVENEKWTLKYLCPKNNLVSKYFFFAEIDM